MIVDPLALRAVLPHTCGDAGLDPRSLVVWIVEAKRPPGATPIAYLQPAAGVRGDTVQVFRAVGAERAAAFAGSAHRIAVWQELPGVPGAALGPMLRHELEHAARWERSGTAFYEADERLRASLGPSGYAQLPTEREANAAAAAHARRTLGPAALGALESLPELADVFAAEPPGDVVGETLARLGEEVVVVPARLELLRAETVICVVAPVSGGMR